MRKFLFALICILAIFIIYNLYNPPRSRVVVAIPAYTLEKIGLDIHNIYPRNFFMLSTERNCKLKIPGHNYTVMFNQYLANWRDVRIWRQHVTLYLTWQDIWQMQKKVYLCIQLNNNWEPAWEGAFRLKGIINLYMPYMSIYCNKKNVASTWECNGYDALRNKEEIYDLLIKYDENITPNKRMQSDQLTATPLVGA